MFVHQFFYLIYQYMKAFRLLLLFALSALVTDTSYAQVQPSYEQQWKKVDDLVKKSGQPKTALEEVRKIYARAKREGQDAQLIKALIYQAPLQSDTRENNETTS